MPTSGTGPFWSVILPAERTNYITNPSFEYGTAGWETVGGNAALGTVSGTSVIGAWGASISPKSGNIGTNNGIVNTSAFALDNTSYVLSAYIKASGSVALLAGGVKDPASPGWAANLFGSVAGSFSDWGRLTLPFTPLVSTGYVFVMPANSGTVTGAIVVDGVQLENGTIATTYIDGDQPGCTWNGLPHASRSTRGRDVRSGGEVVRLDDIGFTVDTSPGIGAPPFNTISQSYAQLDGGEFQRQRKAVRRFTLTSLVDGTSWGDLHYQRRRLIEALRIENTPSQQPLRLLYSGAGGTLGINAVWDAGVEFTADGQSFAEGVVASFTAFDPDWTDQLQQGTTLADNTLIDNPGKILARSSLGKWESLIPDTAFGLDYPVTLTESIDGGTLYVGGGTMSTPSGDSYGLHYVTFTGGIRGQIGEIGVSFVDGFVQKIAWDFDYSRLFILGQSLGVGGTVTGQLGWWNPANNTYGTAGWVGTGTRFVGAGAVTPAVGYDILPWSPGTYYIGGGPFHRVNGTLLGSNWNILRWDGQVGGWSAAPPVSATGTGFVTNDEYYGVGLGSTPGRVRYLTRFDRTRILVSAASNTLRGFGTGFNAALYDVRGTWGTIPGYRISMQSIDYFGGDGYTAEDRSVYHGFSGSASLGTTLLKIQGLTASPVGTVSSGAVNAIENDPDTVAWVGGYGFNINNVAQNYAIIRTNGYDYQPPDYIGRFNVQDIYKAGNGTTYFAIYDITDAGTAASLGTIVNNGMSNVYPTLRLRNSTAGTAGIVQWANMTTKEYVWFALNMLPGEVATLQTGPGQVAFTSNYRGDILSTVVGGSKLASWKLLPGANIVSFLADSDGVTADMYWTPRHHSADGTGIV
jgi:hypothetical protein